MAEFSFEELNKQQESKQQATRTERPRVGYFSLKDDGDEAIVRFNYSSSKEFNLVTVHTVKIGERYRDISCLDDNCPFCTEYDNKSRKFYVKLIEYTRDENGQIVATPKVWKRPAMFAQTLNSYLIEYGDLKNIVFKIKRRGKKGELSTTYDLMLANPSIYKDELYAKDFSGFDNFDLSRHSYMNKTREEMFEFIEKGEFPQINFNKPNETAPYIPAVDNETTAVGTFGNSDELKGPKTGTPITETNTGFQEEQPRPRRTYTF